MKILYIQPWNFSAYEEIANIKNARITFTLPRTIFEVGLLASKGNVQIKYLDLNLCIMTTNLDAKSAVETTLEKQIINDKFAGIFISWPTVAQGNVVSHLIQIVKEICPETPLIVGGAAVSLVGSDIFRFWPQVDAYYIGDGWEIPQLVKKLTQNKLEKIPGVTTMNYQSKTDFSPIKKLIDGYKANELYSAGGTLEFPKYIAEYQRVLGTKPIGLLEMMRGCPYACTFCAINNNNGGVRYREPETVASEVEFLLEQGISEFYMLDPTFGLDQFRTLRLLEYLKKIRSHRPELKLWGITRCDRINKTFAKQLKEAGFYAMSIGVETMDRNQLAFVDKRSDPQISQQAVEILASNGICSRLLLMHFPSSYDEATIRFLLNTQEKGIEIILQGSMYRPLYQQKKFKEIPDFRQWDQEIDARDIGLDTDASIFGWLITNLAFPSISIRPEGDKNLQKRLEILDLDFLFKILNIESMCLKRMERNVLNFLRVGYTFTEVEKKLVNYCGLTSKKAKIIIKSVKEKIQRGLPKRYTPAKWQAVISSTKPFHFYYYQPESSFQSIWTNIKEGNDQEWFDKFVLTEGKEVINK